LRPEDLFWIAAHPDLRGDPLLGDDALKRFLPSRFDVNGFALDAKGLRCQSLACPSCHLSVPRILVEVKPIFISIIGAPSSGKSYFLASTIWETRQRCRALHVSFTDADPVANQIISSYEQKLFLSDRPTQFVAIPKTEEDGELYQLVNYGTRQELYARPFVFALRPMPEHYQLTQRRDVRILSRALCLYDNAGEHFQPKLESELSPATDHLALSEALIYVFDPLQHPRFRQLCRAHSSDPQLDHDFRSHRQDEILLEAAKRIRQKANLAQHERFRRPLIVVVNKFDVWQHLLNGVELPRAEIYQPTADGIVGVNLSLIEDISKRVRQLLNETAPEVVAACEGFCDDVTFIPVSPQGCSPERDQGLLGVRPGNLKPIWAEVPLLYAVGRIKCPLIPTVSRRAEPTVPPQPGQSVEAGQLRVFKETGTG
jgi:hypothetical protein